MLVLGRKQNESVVIEGRIKVTVLGIKSGRIRLGIEAPQDVRVRRSELLESERSSVVVDACVRSKSRIH